MSLLRGIEGVSALNTCRCSQAVTLKGRAAPGNGELPGTEREVRSLSLVRNSRNGVELKKRKGKKRLLDIVVV